MSDIYIEIGEHAQAWIDVIGIYGAVVEETKRGYVEVRVDGEWHKLIEHHANLLDYTGNIELIDLITRGGNLAVDGRNIQACRLVQPL